MISSNSKNQIAKSASKAVIAACLLVQLSTPAFAQQYSSSVEQDSLLPPEVLPLDPQVAQKLAASQAAAQTSGLSEMQTPGLTVSGTPNGSMGQAMTSQQTRQNVMDSMMNQGSFQPNIAGSNQGTTAQNNTGSSDWIMPGQGQSQQSTQYGNVEQSQIMSAPPKNPVVRYNTSRMGFSNALGAVTGLGATALIGTMMLSRRPANLAGLGMAGLMMTGFGTRNAFRF
jgi:hypothetical protein